MERLSIVYLNQYAQEIIDFDDLYKCYLALSQEDRDFFREVLLDLIQQSGCKVEDIDAAVDFSHIKSTNNSCVIARKGIFYHNLKRIYSVDKEEVAIHFLASLFRVGYKRKRQMNDQGKWWYVDLK